ncbi:MAG: gamma-glutamyltransferase [Gemmatimonadota bacterium]|nr:gamma-glutamyltransferase [Gemmatimonadota bacterium]
MIEIRSPLLLRSILAASLLFSGCAPETPPPSTAAPRAERGTGFPEGWAFPAGSISPVRATGGMVSTTDRVASEIGAEILRRGGNAVDATVATHFALAVVNPEAGNIGGGGFLVVRMADGTSASLDFREMAPQKATRNMYLDPQGNVTDRSVVGHLAAGVPGSVAGMWEAHRRFGSLPWADLVRPAIHLAEGVVVHERLARSLRDYEDRFRRFPSTAKVFLPGGRVPRVGDRFEQKELAETFRRIARDGKDGFYRGRTAELVEAEMRRGGGIMTAGDLARYEAKWRDPLRFGYRGHEVISMPPPSSGGATLAEILNILEGYDLRALGHHSPAHVHLYTEAAKRAFADRNAYLADPDFVPQPTARMASDTYAAERRASIPRDRATPSLQVQPGLGATPARAAAGGGTHTTHYSIVDAKGNAVAVTTTINSLYGNLVVVEGAGFFLNNEMDDFAAKPGTPNQFGLVQGEANAIQPGKRMLSAMTPTIVLDPSGRVRLVTGSPGGPTIISSVAETVSNVIDFQMDAAASMAAPRLHHQHLPDALFYERGGLDSATVAALRAMGHDLRERGGYQGDVQTIMVLPNGELAGVADPRRGGAAVGVEGPRQVVQ